MRNLPNLVRKETDEGIYYYSNEMSYLLGPIKHDETICFSFCSYFVFEKDDNNEIVQVFCIVYDWRKKIYICGNFVCPEGLISYKNIYGAGYFFLTQDKKLFWINPSAVKIKPKFKLLISNIDFDTFEYRNGIILAFKKNIPVFITKFDVYKSPYIKSDIIEYSYELTLLRSNEYGIYKAKDDDIIVLVDRHRSFFVVKGKNCYWTSFYNDGDPFPKSILIVEVNDEVNEIYIRGEKL